VNVKERSAREIWEAVLGELQLQVTKTNFDTWLRETVGLSYEDGQFVVGVSSPFVVEWLDKQLHSLIEKTLISVTGRDPKVRFQIHHDELGIMSTRGAKASSPSLGLRNRMTNSCTLNPKYTFQSFIVGHCNRLAHSFMAGWGWERRICYTLSAISFRQATCDRFM
jgi:chromosomal replication initiator protein